MSTTALKTAQDEGTNLKLELDRPANHGGPAGREGRASEAFELESKQTRGRKPPANEKGKTMKVNRSWLAVRLERITKTTPFNHSPRTKLLALPMLAGLAQVALCGLLLFGLLPQTTAAADTHRWVLSVKPGFSPSDVVVLGGTCRWYWPEAGIVAVDSANPNFGVMAEGRVFCFDRFRSTGF